MVWNPKYTWGLIGLGIGAVSGFSLAKFLFYKKHEAYIEERVQTAIEGYLQAIYEAEEEEQENPGESDVNKYSRSEPIDEGNIDYTSFYHKPSPKELMRLNNLSEADASHPQDSEDEEREETQEEKDERYDAELKGDQKMHPDPFIIDEDDFADENNHYDKETLYWYDNDEILATEGDEVIENPLATIGNFIDLFDDPGRECFFVRNPRLATDYTVIRLEESFDEHLGVIPDWGD